MSAVYSAFSFSVEFQKRDAAENDAGREFALSATYGVLAGTLVGAASLAFSDKPGDNLNKVARGASIGLYAGILLGLYIIYAVPSDGAEEEAAAAGVTKIMKPLPHRSIELPRLMVLPIIGERGLEGAAANYAVLRF